MDISIRVDPVDRVKNMVRHSLVASPSVTNRELFDRAKEIAPAVVDGMSLRQFHAKFRLPITRHEMGRRRTERKKSDTPRAQHSNGQTATSKPDGTTARGTRGKRTRSRTSQGAGSAASNRIRADVRSAIVDFAVALESAEQRGELVRVVSTIDDVVERILSLTARKAATVSTNGNGSSETSSDGAASS